jgi:hypothetical protein
VLSALEAIRIQKPESEAALYDEIHRRLHDAGMQVLRQVKIPCGRLDFLVGGIVIEAKVGRVWRLGVLRQCARYARIETVEAVVLVTEFGVAPAPASMADKPFRQVAIHRAWGVAT